MNDVEHAIHLFLSGNRDESISGESLIYSLVEKNKMKQIMFELLGHPEHHSRACDVLYDIGTQEDAFQLLPYLTSDNNQIVMSTIRVLGRIGNSAVIPPLCELWDSTNMFDLDLRFALSDVCDRMTHQELESFRTSDSEILNMIVQNQFSRLYRREQPVD